MYYEEVFGEFILVKHRDAGLPTYTYFWTKDNKVVSPYFGSEEDAKDWLTTLK